MFDPHKLSSETVARLEKHAKPFTDTVDTVVNRILDAYEATQASIGSDDDVVGGPTATESHCVAEVFRALFLILPGRVASAEH